MILMTVIFLENVKKNLEIYKTFNENPSSGSRGVTLGQTDFKKITVVLQEITKLQIRTRETYVLNTHRCYLLTYSIEQSPS